MKNKKNLLIIPIIIILIILLGAGAFAYVFLQTDLLKSDRQLFFEYALGDKSGEILKEYYAKQLETPYEFSGSAYLESDIPEDFLFNINEFAKYNIDFEGTNDMKTQNFDVTATLNLGEEEIMPVSVAKTDSLLGITTEALGGYITVDYEKEAENELGLEEEAKMIMEYIYQKREMISEEDMEYLKQTYMNILMESFKEEMFSKVMAEDATGYRMEITYKEVAELLIEILEKLKDDERSIDILNKQIEQTMSFDKENLEDNKVEKQDIEDLIKGIKETVLTMPEYNEEYEDVDALEKEFNEKLNSKIIAILWINSNEEISKIEVSSEKLGKLQIETKKTLDTLQYIGTIHIYETEGDEEDVGDENLTINFGVKYTGLETMEKVKESYNYGISETNSDQNGEINIYLDNTVEFNENPEITVLDKKNTWLLTTNSDEKVERFLEKKSEIVRNDLAKRLEDIELPQIFNFSFETIDPIEKNDGFEGPTEQYEEIKEGLLKEAINLVFQDILIDKMMQGSSSRKITMQDIEDNIEKLEEYSKMHIEVVENKIIGINENIEVTYIIDTSTSGTPELSEPITVEI